jgi:hypothetical protein
VLSIAGALSARFAIALALALDDKSLVLGWDPEALRDLDPQLAHRHVRRLQRDRLHLRRRDESGDLDRA